MSADCLTCICGFDIVPKAHAEALCICGVPRVLQAPCGVPESQNVPSPRQRLRICGKRWLTPTPEALYLR